MTSAGAPAGRRLGLPHRLEGAGARRPARRPPSPTAGRRWPSGCRARRSVGRPARPGGEPRAARAPGPSPPGTNTSMVAMVESVDRGGPARGQGRSRVPIRRAATTRPTPPRATSTPTWASQRPGQLAEVGRPHQRHPVVEGAELHQPGPAAVARQRVEGGREQEERQRHRRHVLEVRPRAHERGQGHARRREGGTDQHAGGNGEHHPGRRGHAQRRHRGQEGDRVQRAPQRGRGDLAQGDVGRTQGRGQHGVVQPVRLAAWRTRPSSTRRRRRSWPRPPSAPGPRRRRSRPLWPSTVMSPTSSLEPDADRQQVEQRLEEAADDDQPDAPVHHGRALHHALGPAHGQQHRGQDPQPHVLRAPSTGGGPADGWPRAGLIGPTSGRTCAGTRGSRRRRTR